MFMWVIYENPSDFPGKFVTRSCQSNPADPDRPMFAPEPAAVVDSLTGARSAVPRGCVRIPRHEDDDPVIVEVWL